MSDRSVQARDVSRSAVVTGDGNTVTLAFGDSGASIPLLRKQFPPPERRRRQAPSDRPPGSPRRASGMAGRRGRHLGPRADRTGGERQDAARYRAMPSNRRRPCRPGRMDCGLSRGRRPERFSRNPRDTQLRVGAANASGHRQRRAVSAGLGAVARPAVFAAKARHQASDTSYSTRCVRSGCRRCRNLRSVGS